MVRWVSCVAALAATGCVSSGTWSAVHEVERDLDARDVDLEARADAERARELGATDPGGALGCDQVVARVLAGYPGLRAPRTRARAALASARAEGALPAPRAELEVWDFPIGDPQLADREGMYMLGVSQEIPPGAMLDGRARAAAEEAREALAELAEIERGIRAAAAHACVDWAQGAAESSRLEAAEAVLAQMLDAMRARYAAGGEALADLARMESELARVGRMRVEADARRAGAEGRLDAMLGRRAGEPLPEPPELEAPELPEGVDALAARAAEVRGLVSAARARAHAAEARAWAADAQASVPTFMVGATYMQMPAARAGLGVQLGLTLPWLWSGEGAARDAARLEAEAALDEVARMERDVRVEVAGAARTIEVVARALAHLRERERPAAERALEAIAATYASGEVDLVAWLDAARALRELEVEEVRLLGDGAHARAELESALGAPIAAAPREEER